MSSVKLIADSGATKAEWCLLQGKKAQTIFTQGISPYFFDTDQITEILQKELLPSLKAVKIDELREKKAIKKKSAREGKGC